MTLKKIAAFSLFFLIAFPLAKNPVLATPSIGGHTGLIKMPTAEALPYKKTNFGIDYMTSNGEDSSDDNDYFYKVNLGALENLEIGFVGGTQPDEGVFINAKYFLLSNNEELPMSIALGVENLGAKNDTGAYLVASKRFKGDILGHFGFIARFAESLDASVMLGAEYLFDDKLVFLGDVVGNNDLYEVNLGLRYFFKSEFAMHLSIVDIGQTHSDETIITLGLSVASFI